MWKNYLKIAYRTLTRQKGYSVHQRRPAWQWG